MEFEDDDGDVNEIDIVPDTDEDEEREDETMQEEEGQESDEEDGFGLIQTTHEGDDEGQFEDREPLSHFLDANVFLDNLDDIDRSTGFEISRTDRSALNEVSVHPLMQRTNILAS
ncbi:unnamed protein product, partial [Anisakis simplex]|uniref:TBP-binding domain-containing protein n=1 Tax=Anisakis simplex TaxID=6269 RepID=A0A0M3JHZ2_ANISI